MVYAIVRSALTSQMVLLKVSFDVAIKGRIQCATTSTPAHIRSKSKYAHLASLDDAFNASNLSAIVMAIVDAPFDKGPLLVQTMEFLFSHSLVGLKLCRFSLRVSGI